jgi:hypothetical protein
MTLPMNHKIRLYPYFKSKIPGSIFKTHTTIRRFFNVQIIKTKSSLAIVFIFLFTTSAISQTVKAWQRYEYPFLTAENTLWLGTPKGLFQYHPDEDSWSTYGTHNGLPSNDIRILFWDSEYLWVATSGGIAYGDIKLNKWHTYTVDNGLPSNLVYSIAVQGDYVWLATDRGAARFDKVIQEWELFTVQGGLPDSLIYDIAVDGDYVYFASANGLAEYETNSEKWRYYGVKEGISADTIRFIYPTTESLWLFTGAGPCRFNKKLHTSQCFSEPGLSYSAIHDLSGENDQFWLANAQGVLIYDSGSNRWRHYQEEVNLPGLDVTAFDLSQESKWFLTDKGITLFNEKTKSWYRYDKTHGLSSDSYRIVTSFSGKTFLVNEGTIDYFKPDENRWTIYPLQDLKGGENGQKSFVSLDKEKGSYWQINPDLRLSLSGSRYTYRYTRNQELALNSKKSSSDQERVYRGDLKGQLSLPGGRTINGFYNNTDFSQTLYGVKYKGTESDFVQEINWGDIRLEQGKKTIVPALGVFGASGKIEYGRKTPRYKRSLLSAHGWSGEKTSGVETDFFTGNMKSSSAMIRDINYIKNAYYDVNNLGALQPGTETIFVDDGESTTNTANTRIHYTAAGLTGDFDLKIAYVDYYFDAAQHVLYFIQPITDKSTVIIQGISNGILTETVLQTPEQPNQMLRNRYFTGAKDIIPHSFRLDIYDDLGQLHPLSEFQLDQDHDQHVDPQWMDYTQGILTFPIQEPFPASVYAVTQPQSHYVLKTQFETQLSVFNLQHADLIRGSETVTIDNEILTPGQDYVLDYTSGTLLVIKEGIVAEDSEIEVKYEYYRDTREKIHLAGAAFSPSDNMYLEVNGYRFEQESRDQEHMDSFNGIDMVGEFRMRVKDIDIKLTPEVSQNQGTGLHLRSDISSQKVRFFSIIEQYDPGFQKLAPNKFQLGDLASRLAVGTTFYPVESIDISTGWSKRETPPDENKIKGSEEDFSGKILFSKSFFPAVSLSGRQRILLTDDGKSIKETFKGDLEYQLPQSLLQVVSFKSMRLYGIWRSSQENTDALIDSSGFDQREKIYSTQYLRLDLSPADQIQFNSYFRASSVRGKNENLSDDFTLLNNRKKLFLDLTMDRLNWINVNARYQGEITSSHPSSIRRDHNIWMSRNLQSNFRFYPGKWIDFFNPFTFELNYQPNWRGVLRNITSNPSLLEQYEKPPDGQELVSSENNKLYQIRGEWRPVASIFVYGGYDFYRTMLQNANSRLYSNINQLNHKIEFRPGMNSLITLQYLYYHNEKLDYSTTIRNNPMIWFENRWTEKLQTKLNLTYLQEDKHTGRIYEYSKNFSPLLGFTYRFKSGNSSRTELRDDISLTFYQNNKKYLAYTSYSNSFAIDWYPASVLILRFRLVTTYKDNSYTNLDYFYSTGEFRLTAQF